jgi:hypothetical protein
MNGASLNVPITASTHSTEGGDCRSAGHNSIGELRSSERIRFVAFRHGSIICSFAEPPTTNGSILKAAEGGKKPMPLRAQRRSDVNQRANVEQVRDVTAI